MRPDLSIVVPAYNEAESLPDLADQIRAALDGAGLSRGQKLGLEAVGFQRQHPVLDEVVLIPSVNASQ